MKWTRKIGMLLLAIWLILTGLLPLVGASLGRGEILLPILAIAAGVFIFIDR